MVLLIIFYALLLLTEEYLMKLIEFVIDHYDISQQIGGMIIAFGSIVPELSTNMISSFSRDKHINLGLSTIMGSGTFDFTI
jgi:Ca2+/Na+ antiporter